MKHTYSIMLLIIGLLVLVIVANKMEHAHDVALEDEEVAGQEILQQLDVREQPPTVGLVTYFRRGIKFMDCKDTDGGKSYFERGDATVVYRYLGSNDLSMRRRSLDEYCRGKTLLEYACSGPVLTAEYHRCEHACFNGACQ